LTRAEISYPVHEEAVWVFARWVRPREGGKGRAAGQKYRYLIQCLPYCVDCRVDSGSLGQTRGFLSNPTHLLLPFRLLRGYALQRTHLHHPLLRTNSSVLGAQTHRTLEEPGPRMGHWQLARAEQCLRGERTPTGASSSVLGAQTHRTLEEPGPRMGHWQLARAEQCYEGNVHPRALLGVGAVQWALSSRR
jgi:hypothetical protein